MQAGFRLLDAEFFPKAVDAGFDFGGHLLPGRHCLEYHFAMEDLMLERVQNEGQPTRNFCVGKVHVLEDVPSFLRSIPANFCLFLAVDATAINDEEISRTAKLLLEQGVAYFCVWGSDCERVHDLFDLERLPEEPRDRVVMTTWHSKDSLSPKLYGSLDHAQSRPRALRQIAGIGLLYL